MRPTTRWHKGVLAVGFLAAAVAVNAAHAAPASGYEVSIYRGTPTNFWIGVGVAVVGGGGGAPRRSGRAWPPPDSADSP